MRILGAILAGGAASRFGSDKGVALLHGRPLIAHVRDALAPQVASVAIVGRDWPGLARIDDRPHPGLGPLAALAGALHRAAGTGFDAVLTVPCDAPRLPADLAARLAGPGAAFVDGAPVIGLWPAALAARLDAHLATGGSRSMRGWIARCDARCVVVPSGIANVNRPADLAALLDPSPDDDPA